MLEGVESFLLLGSPEERDIACERGERSSDWQRSTEGGRERQSEAESNVKLQKKSRE
jgi:hypothetical protein